MGCYTLPRHLFGHVVPASSIVYVATVDYHVNGNGPIISLQLLYRRNPKTFGVDQGERATKEMACRKISQRFASSPRVYIVYIVYMAIIDYH